MPKADTKEWPPEHAAQLRTMIEMGMDARYIGERLGYSRNAVLGKAHRLKLSFKKSIKTNNGRTLFTGAFKKTKPNNDFPPKEPIGDGCLWPMGDKWCGCDRQDDGPYCSFHQKQSRTGQRALTDSEIMQLVSGSPTRT